ncbi:UL16-binding protein 3-like [Sorex fumeus]|uniref:UL16-binding protein 3-like n=1 Tax=Sorex fumeus TaxID=62283 RepID=UPI0024ACC50A|nr:UL16-binding protein 3-like [Sorex fumeus]
MAFGSKTSLAPPKLMAGLGPTLTLLLVSLLVRAAPADIDIHSLCYTYKIPLESSSGQPWCDVQGQLDADNFLSYDSGSDTVKNMSILGVILSATETWKDQIEMLKEAGNLFRQSCPDIKLENLADRGAGSVCLQVMLTCQRISSGNIYGFWEFGRNGQIFLTFRPESEKWEMEHSRAKSLKEKWEKDSDLIKFLKKMSMGDCKRWLKAFVEHQDRNGNYERRRKQ